MDSFHFLFKHHNILRCVAVGQAKQLMENGQIDEAEKIQCNLNVEYPNLCTPWMINAVRQLILSRNKSKTSCFKHHNKRYQTVTVIGTKQ